ncbi:Nucleoporin nup84, partial [Apophysomyces sp. BC1021]
SIKKWLNTITDASSIDAEEEEENTEDEVEAEIHSMFGINRSTILSKNDDHDKSKKRRSLRPENKADFENLNRILFTHVRRGELDKAIAISELRDEPWRTVLLKTYAETSQKIMEGKKLAWDNAQRNIWKQSCKGLMHQDGARRYEKALYAVFCGNVQDVIPVCKTWEDVLWVYCNAREQEGLEKHQNQSTKPAQDIDDDCHLDPKVIKLALNRDTLLQKNDTLQFFHSVQSKLLSKDLESLVTQLHTICVQNEWHAEFGVSVDSEFIEERFRFASSLILYLCSHCGWQLDEKSDAILTAYVKRNADFDGDKEERSLLVEMGIQYNLDMVQILRSTYTKIMDEFISGHSPRADIEAREHEVFEIEGEIARDTLPCLRAVEWLSMNDALVNDLIQAANLTIRHFLRTRQIYLVKAVLKTVPEDMLNVCVLQTHGRLNIPDFLDEFGKHQLLVECLEAYQVWERLRHAKPEDLTTRGTLSALRSIHEWKRNFETLSETLSVRQRSLLESRWLRAPNLPSDDILRKIYIPELTVQLYTVLSESDPEKCDELIMFIVDAKHGFSEELLATGKTVKLFSQMARARSIKK